MEMENFGVVEEVKIPRPSPEQIEEELMRRQRAMKRQDPYWDGKESDEEEVKEEEIKEE